MRIYLDSIYLLPIIKEKIVSVLSQKIILLASLVFSAFAFFYGWSWVKKNKILPVNPSNSKSVINPNVQVLQTKSKRHEKTPTENKQPLVINKGLRSKNDVEGNLDANLSGWGKISTDSVISEGKFKNGILLKGKKNYLDVGNLKKEEGTFKDGELIYGYQTLSDGRMIFLDPD